MQKILDRVWNLSDILVDGDKYSESLEKLIHKTIKKVSYDYENLKANTAIAALMSLLNEFVANKNITKADFRTFLMLLNPVAPHITEELWEQNNLGGYLNESSWPVYDEEKTIDNIVEMPVQFNGKLRFTIEVSKDANVDQAREIAMKNEAYAKNIKDKKVIKEIFVPGKIYNIVVK